MWGMHAAPMAHALIGRIAKRFGRATYALVAVAAMALSVVGIAVAAGSNAPAKAAVAAPAAVAPPVVADSTNWDICHSKNDDKEPYVSESPDVSTIVKTNGHISHTGPVWDPTLKAAHIQWGDIIPPFIYAVDGKTYSLNWTAEGQAIFNNGCNIPTAVSPGSVTVVPATCDVATGTLTAPTITPAAVAGVSYSFNPDPYVAGDSVTVTATISDPSKWFQSPGTGGWTFVDLHTETYDVNLAPAPACGAVKTPLTPQNPSVTQSACSAVAGGAVTAPTLTPAGAPAGISYSAPPGPYTAGTTVVVTATISDPANYEFSGAPPAGWIYDTASSAHFDVVFAAAPAVCPAAKSILAPDDPTWTEATCTRGTLIDPTVTPATTADVTYSVKPGGPYNGGDTVVVTATIDKPLLDRFDSASMPAPWVYVSDTEATFGITFKAAPACGGVPGPSTVVPENPTPTQSVCLGPGITDPKLDLPTTTGVSYAAKPASGYKPGDTVTVTATIDNAAANEFSAATMPAGWTFVSATQATYEVTFDAAPTCSGVGGLHAVAVPDPTFTDPGCASGKPFGGTYTIVAMDHVSYTVAGKAAGAGVHPAAGGSTVTIVAKADTGYALVGDSTFTHTFKADPQACLGVLPEAAGPGGPLANTGAGPIEAELAWAAGLVLVGAAALFAGRRRQRPDEA